MGGEVSTDFKSSNRIEISQLVQVLLNFELIPGVPHPRGWGGGWMGVRGGDRIPPTHMHTHAHVRTRTHAHATYDIIGNPWDFPKIQWEQPFAWNYHVYHACMCVRVRACVRMRVHVCGGHPPTTPHPPIHPAPPPPEPQGAQNTKIQ